MISEHLIIIAKLIWIPFVVGLGLLLILLKVDLKGK